MSAADIIITVVLAVLVGAVCIYLYRNKKSGKGGCSGDCGSCPGCH